MSLICFCFFSYCFNKRLWQKPQKGRKSSFQLSSQSFGLSLHGGKHTQIIDIAYFLHSCTVRNLLPKECCHPQWVCLPISMNVIKITPHRHTQRLISQVILTFVKMTIDINYHTILISVSFETHQVAGWIQSAVKDLVMNGHHSAYMSTESWKNV